MNTQEQAKPEAIWPALEAAGQFLCVGTHSTEFPGDRDEAREQFCRHRAIHLRGLLTPEFLRLNLHLCATGTYVGDKPGGPEVEAPQRVNRLIDAAFQRSAVLRWMEDVTGVEGLRTFSGRLTQTQAGTGRHRGWHDDLVESDLRRLALVINFSPEPYTGGEFQLALRTGEPIFEHTYASPNEAILFLVDPALMHQVRPVKTGGPRRVFAGWATV